MSRVSAGATSEPNRSFVPGRFRIFPRINVNNTAAAGVHERVYGPRRGTRRDPVAISIIRASRRSINLYEPHVPRGNSGRLTIGG